MSVDITSILKSSTPVYVTDPGTSHTGENARARRHVATILRPMRDYGRNTASYYEVTRHDGSWGVYSADYIELREEGQDAKSWKKVSPGFDSTKDAYAWLKENAS